MEEQTKSRVVLYGVALSHFGLVQEQGFKLRRSGIHLHVLPVDVIFDAINSTKSCIAHGLKTTNRGSL